MARELTWNEEMDVVVVGFGGAGVCAAIEATENGSRVLVIERFAGGGATRISGGVIYAGGGSAYQQRAGFSDTPENMCKYLETEVKDAVTKETLQAFCEQSCDNLAWLEAQGVCFDSSFCPFKTSYPPAQYYLYYSGNESFPPHNIKAHPAPRGHRAKGKGLSGGALFEHLKESALAKGVNVRYQSTVTRLIVGDNGRVTGLEMSFIPAYSVRALLHRFLNHALYRLRYVAMASPAFLNVFKRLFSLLERRGRSTRVRARQGVVLAAGGFVFNREMIEEYAPAYMPGTPLGTLGDDGSGIRLGEAVGGATAHMDRVSAWRFISPPEALAKGVLVDAQGKRICNEQLYGAQVGEAIVERHGGKATLIIDADIWRQARQGIGTGKTWWFQTMTALINLYLNIKKADTIDTLASRCGLPPADLRATIESYNEVARSERKDPMGKSSEHLHALAMPPFYAIDCSLGSSLFICPTITLGGLTVDEESGAVKRKDGSVIDGLYAVGRNAAGIPSRGYVSGLAIAHGVFSGRRAGRHVSGTDRQ